MCVIKTKVAPNCYFSWGFQIELDLNAFIVLFAFAHKDLLKQCKQIVQQDKWHFHRGTKKEKKTEKQKLTVW